MQLSATRFDKRKGHILVMFTQKHVSDIDSNCNVLFDNILNIRTVNWLFVLYIYISESYVPLARRWHVFDLIAKNVCCVRYQWYTETVIMHNIFQKVSFLFFNKQTSVVSFSSISSSLKNWKIFMKYGYILNCF